jgi:aldose 1-epimerase
LKPAALLAHTDSGRAMEVLTTEPGIHCYNGSSLSSSCHQPYQGICLEAQHFPDSPNQALFPNTILQPGAIYHQKTVYRFFNNCIKK